MPLCTSLTRQAWTRHSSNFVALVKSASNKSGSCEASSSILCQPVATATVRPTARAQRMSSGVSPMTQMRSGECWPFSLAFTSASASRNIVTVEMLIAEAAEGEMLVQSEVAKLHLCARTDVASQQTQRHIAAAQFVEQQQRCREGHGHYVMQDSRADVEDTPR